MPGGEVFYSPIEDSAEGEVTFCEFPAALLRPRGLGCAARVRARPDRRGERRPTARSSCSARSTPTRARAGSASSGSAATRGSSRFTKNVGFDEKIDGTIHLAVGNSYSSTGGTNVSSVHWDMVKDLRNGGRVYLDGELVQEDGRWLARAPRRLLSCVAYTRAPRRSRPRALHSPRSARGSRAACARPTPGAGWPARTASRRRRGSRPRPRPRSACSISGSTSSRLSSGGRPSRSPPPPSAQCAAAMRGRLGRVLHSRRDRRAAAGRVEERQLVRPPARAPEHRASRAASAVDGTSSSDFTPDETTSTRAAASASRSADTSGGSGQPR